MPGSFFDPWNSTLRDFEACFSETWVRNGIEWPAIAIERDEEDQHIIKGGILNIGRVRIHVRQEVFEASQVQMGDFVSARGIDMSVANIESDGDASKTLVCTAKGTDVWR